MSLVFTQLLDGLLGADAGFERVWFAADRGVPPSFSYQVNFPRLELVFDGEYVNRLWCPEQEVREVSVLPGQALYIPPNGWNKPDWERECTVLSLLFGKRQLGLSLVVKRRGETGFADVKKHSIPGATGRALDPTLQALDTLAREAVTAPMDNYLLLALLAGSRQLLLESAAGRARGADLFHGICIYIQENFHRPICRESIAARFNLSASHLSRLFRQQGHMRLADYIGWVRLERAKFMLKKYRFRLEEVSRRCGYRDVNYFCRVFKQKTGLTPSQYRELSQPGEGAVTASPKW
ncbi:helix-turn-helix transcriptional regulator [Aeromonas schubertii]|uniref:helix-turn-helix transcriptional regulator n=1 Tax=Aeromonas TaxID=642 RepID=UPI00067E9E4D|nr:AraC family transcriptional regulator [Aeromonas schubertii]KUE80599.1 AraC family transcriptional regulator [Aeromonas schubertii]